MQQEFLEVMQDEFIKELMKKFMENHWMIYQQMFGGISTGLKEFQ